MTAGSSPRVDTCRPRGRISHDLRRGFVMKSILREWTVKSGKGGGGGGGDVDRIRKKMRGSG